ncbi:hypothetical protein Cob_v003321 [Colletotrichum orbiculare MAFF 240422]|uniref:Uncharacterized protein n=1 Tax=Colletotrichum orbiculare (strain 104-T / ATCC 96160 / CBS 514.97 / LARS 414 / MAFF 240422) TaxID=1213857 RepID=A0A484G030_COLOR|nr:hypothetical protein Cob_v003321 [Colletotrichum orbiculare MAFF 240422]
MLYLTFITVVVLLFGDTSHSQELANTSSISGNSIISSSDQGRNASLWPIIKNRAVGQESSNIPVYRDMIEALTVGHILGERCLDSGQQHS